MGQILELNEICSGWDKMLGNLFGEGFKNKARPVSLKDKTLTVDCMNSVWAGELQIRQPKIIQQINNIFGKELVKKIRFIS